MSVIQALHSEAKLYCPLCRQETEVIDVGSLPNNVYAQHIIYLNQKLMGAVQRDMLVSELTTKISAVVYKFLFLFCRSMHWCFVCDGVVKPSCRKSQHAVLDASRFAKELRFKMRQSKSNLTRALDKRRIRKQSLEMILTFHNNQAKVIQKEIDDNDQELNQLERLVETEPHFITDSKKISKRFKETNTILVTSTNLMDESQGQLDAVFTLYNKTDYSWRQKAHLLRSTEGRSELVEFYSISADV